MKNFNRWLQVKEKTEQQETCAHFREGEIFFIKLGENIGYEQCGKGRQFIRPMLVVQKFNQRIFWGIPLSTTKKQGLFYHSFSFNKRNSTVVLTQLRLTDSKRLVRKIGGIPMSELNIIKNKLKNLLQ